jgi:hypothetical protein
MNLIKIGSSLFVSGLLVACGGGGGGSAPAPAPSSGFSQTYVASATAGEVLRYTFNSQANTYSYVITHSAYGLTNSTGTGTLTKNADGSYSPSESPSSKIYAAQNGLLVGRVRLALNGVNRDVPILGVSNPATSGADVAGTYNFISLQCAGKNFGVYTGCLTAYGSILVTATGANSANYTACESANITNGVGACVTSSVGTLTHAGGGIWELLRTGSANKSYLVAFKAPNNQKVGFVDFNDSAGYGYGQAVVSEQVSPSVSDIAGDYVAQTTLGLAASFSINSNATTSTGLTITKDSPWVGMVKTNSSGGKGVGIAAGTGVYAYRDPQVSAAYFEIGMRK